MKREQALQRMRSIIRGKGVTLDAFIHNLKVIGDITISAVFLSDVVAKSKNCLDYNSKYATYRVGLRILC